MRDYLSGAGAVLMVLTFLTVNSAILGVSTGIVREHCLDIGASNRAQAVEVESKWTYIVWPPGPLSSVDPPGRCVRHSPLREGLSATGAWTLPVASEQVREHVVYQLRNPSILDEVRERRRAE